MYKKILCSIQMKVEETGFLLVNQVPNYIEVTSGRTKFQAGEQVELFCHTSYRYGRGDLAVCRKDAITPVITITSGNTMLAGKYFYFSMPDFDSDPEGLEAVKAYRQALRDIPEQSGFPRNVQWPEMPDVLSTGKSKLGLAKVGI